MMLRISSSVLACHFPSSLARGPAPECADWAESPGAIPSRSTSRLEYRTVTSDRARGGVQRRSEEHTSELQSPYDLVCRLLLEKKKKASDAQNRTKHHKH